MENSGRYRRPLRIGPQTDLLTIPIAEEIVYEDDDLLNREEPILDGDQSQHLAAVIVKRIHARLPGRIHRLAVRVTGNAVVMAGQCSTYYTKQLAQHAAMGVLDYQRLVNNISVRPIR